MSDAFERAAAREEALQTERRHERRGRGARTGFRIHATTFVAVQVMLVVVWLVTGAGYPWFLYPLAGWAVGLAAHFASIRHHYGGGERDHRHS
jgi:hypothetical protein